MTHDRASRGTLLLRRRRGNEGQRLCCLPRIQQERKEPVGRK